MWTWEIKSGNLYSNAGDLIGSGHAGHDVVENGVVTIQGRNNPAMTHVKDIGPLPVGMYTIMPPKDYVTVGKFAMQLIPDITNEMFGRGGFYMHGDSFEDQVVDSDGCPVQQRPVREFVANSNDNRLHVVSEVGLAQTDEEG